MRNLKKILALALALVMSMSLVSVASAADFGDDAEITHSEAADVLNALGVLEGYEDGNFYPDRVVKRGEMAKIVAYIVNGGKDPVLSGQVSFTDTANHWARAYIEYCVGLGIIDGYGDGTFRPDATVTATEAAKMLLIAMGYNSDIRNYTGASWSLNVNVDANQKDLYTDLTYINPSNGLDRDATAQMVYNALNAKGVTRGDSISVEDGKVTYHYTDDQYTMMYRKLGVIRVEGVVTANEYVTLAASETASAAMEDGKTRIVVSNADEIPANELTVGAGGDQFNVSTGKDEIGKAVAIFVKPASSSKSTTKAEVIGSAVLGSNTILTATAPWSKVEKMNTALRNAGLRTSLPGEYYVNGVEVSSTPVHSTITKGYATQFIDNDDDGIVEYVLMDKVDLGKVTAYSTKDEGSITVSTSGSTAKKSDAEDVVGFEDVSRGDYVLFSEVGGKLYVEVAETVTGTLTDYSKQESDAAAEASLWVDGTKYDNSHASRPSDLTNPVGYRNLDKEATFYLDACGYIVGVDGTSVKQYAIATYYNDEAYSSGSITVNPMAQFTFEDGESSAQVVSSKTPYTKLDSNDNAAVYAVLGSYTYNDDDELVINTTGVEIANTGTFKYTAGNVLVSSDGGNLQVNGKNVYMTDDTVMFVVETKNDGPITSTQVDKVTTYVGKDNMPSMEITGGYFVKFFVNSDNEVEAMAVITNGFSAVTDNYLYVIKVVSTASKTKQVMVVLNGEVQTITVNSGDTTKMTTKTLYEYAVDEDGNYDLKRITSDIVSGQIQRVNTNERTIVVNGVEYKVLDTTDFANISDEETIVFEELQVGDTVTVYHNSDDEALGVYVTEGYEPVEDVVLGKDSVTKAVGEGDGFEYNTITVTPDDATFKGNITVTSSDEDVAKPYAAQGGLNEAKTSTKIQLIAAGTCTITVTVDGVSASYELTVTD